MTEDISSALDDTYVMFYIPEWPVRDLSPVCTLDQSLSVANRAIETQGRNLDKWSPGSRDEVARLLHVNWIYNNLALEPIRKPILVHRDQDRLIVDCGDTRLMALNLLDHAVKVSVVITDQIHYQHLYQGWRRIYNNQDLISACGFLEDAHVLFRSSQSHFAIDWLEIGDASTSHHLHDVDQRIRMMQNYLDQQPATFFFDRDWARSTIDWLAYDRAPTTNPGSL